jgi:beta-glucosidase
LAQKSKEVQEVAFEKSRLEIPLLFGMIVIHNYETTFPTSVGQIPIYYSHNNTRRPLANTEGKFESNYIDERNEPLFPFGFGLSYTTFDYSNLKLSSIMMNCYGKISANVDITYTENYDDKEIVQLYTRDLVGSVTDLQKSFII